MIADARHFQSPTNIAGYDPTRAPGDCWYDGETAEKSVQFFNDTLVYLDGPRAGEPFELEPWQADVIRVAFGWKRRDGSRRYRRIFWFVPRKNGKTTISAGMALKCFYADAERRAQCYCAACDKDQSSLLFDMARDQVRGNETFNSVSKVRDSQKRIIHKDRFFRALAASDSGGHGMNLHFGAYDEFHLWRSAKHVEMYESLHTSTGNRQQPLELIITTAGWDRNSLCYKEYQLACQVRDGLIDVEELLPVIYEAGADDDWTAESTWYKANPNLDVTISIEYLRRECERAKHDPSYENTFRRLHLNQWTSQESRWLQMEKWRACRVTEGDIPPDSAVYGGLDLSSTVDVTAWMLLERVDNGWRVRGHYFIPEGRMREAEKRDRVPYSQWVKAGWVTATPGEAIDYGLIHQRILADSERYTIGAVGYDPWNADPTRLFLEDAGVTMLKVRQGVASLSGPCKELERCVIEGVLDHGNDPVLAWMAENVQVRTDENGNIRPVKPDHAGSAKRIDGIVGTVIGLHAALLESPEGPSIYETPGALTL